MDCLMAVCVSLDPTLHAYYVVCANMYVVDTFVVNCGG